MNTISLVDLEITCIIGILPEERVKEQNLLIDIHLDIGDSIITDDIIKDTHDVSYIDLVKNSFPTKGFSSLDGDTIISPGSKKATFDAAGSIIAAIDGVQNKEFKNAFCCVRPPGHHSSKNKAAGFCLLNNVAIGSRYLLNKYKYKRVANFFYII